jgi:hypothetical protein
MLRPAMKAISADVLISAEPDAVRQTAIRDIVPVFEGRGCQLETQGAEGLKLVHRYLSFWAALGGLLIFPLGILVWIFVRREELVTFSFSREADGTRVVIRGQGDAFIKNYVDLIQVEYGTPAEVAAESRLAGGL